MKQIFILTITVFCLFAFITESDARWYSPEMGRFLSEDPIGFAGGVNFYVYAGNNPVNYTDPFGLDRILFNGQYVFWYDDFGNLLSQYGAISGPYGNGRLPEGVYTGGTLRERSDNAGMMCSDGGWSLNLSPNFDTNRDLLRIHPDGNVAGTLGCIGVNCSSHRDLYQRLFNYLRTNPSIPVEVRY